MLIRKNLSYNKLIMNKTTIENTIKFLQRADLKWAEVQAFTECMQWLFDLLKSQETKEETK